MNINFESKPICDGDNKYIKTKVKTYADRIITNFRRKKVPKENTPYKCLSIMMLDSVIKTNKKYYPQTFLEECKYVREKIKTENYIHEDLEKSESDIYVDEYYESFIERILIQQKPNSVCVNHTLLGFYPRQSV